jgi:hypothetical protein
MGSKISEKIKFLLQFKEKDFPAAVTSASIPERIEFGMPEPENYDLYYLDPLTKRKVTICNLFANHDKTVMEITNLLEASRKLVIDTLIENNLLKDRRQSQRPRTPAPEEIRMKS